MPEGFAEESRSLLEHDANERLRRSSRDGKEKRLTFAHPIACCLALYFLVEMFDMISIAPLTALLEKVLCRNFYRGRDPSLIAPGGSVDERYCKLDAIQSELAIIRGWKLAFDALPGKSICWYLRYPRDGLTLRKFSLWLFPLVERRTVWVAS